MSSDNEEASSLDKYHCVPLIAYPVEWEDVRRDNKYPTEDDNNGFIYGIEWMDGEEVTDVTWYISEEIRDAILYIETLKLTEIGRHALSTAKLIVEGTDHLMTLEEFNEGARKNE